jgi:hypothetical protein
MLKRPHVSNWRLTRGSVAFGSLALLWMSATALATVVVSLIYSAAAQAACDDTPIASFASTQAIALGTFTRDKVATATVIVAANGTRTVPPNLRIASDEINPARRPYGGSVTLSGPTNCSFTLTITGYTNSLSNATVSGITGILTPGGAGTFTGTTDASGNFTFALGVSQIVQAIASPNTIGGQISLLVSKNQGTSSTRTTDVTVAGTVVNSLTLTATSATVTMPNVVKPTTGPSSPSGGTANLAVTCSGSGSPTLTYGAGANPFAGGIASATMVSGTSKNTGVGGANSTGACAHLSVAGEAGYFFSTAVGVASSATTGVTFVGNCSSAGNSTVLTGGTAEIYCGATVSISSSAVVGTYTGSYPVTVTYD